MMINRENYEQFFLDYAEGNLSVEQEELLRRFLKFNPDLAEELEGFDLITLPGAVFEFPDKDALKKPFPGNRSEIDLENFEMFCIAYLEKDLSKEQLSAFESFLTENPHLQLQLDLFRKTYLVPETVIFSGKAALKRKKVVPLYRRVLLPLAAAAAIALMLMIGPGNTDRSVEIASVTEPENSSKALEEASNPIENQVDTSPAVLRVIRNHSNPVPKSTYTSPRERGTENTTDEGNVPGMSNTASPQTGTIRLKKKEIEELAVQFDRIVPSAVKINTVSKSSLSLAQRAKIQVERASELIEEDEDLIWSVASKGMKEINRLTLGDTELLASRNEHGSISGFQLRSRYLNITAPIRTE